LTKVIGNLIIHYYCRQTPLLWAMYHYWPGLMQISDWRIIIEWCLAVVGQQLGTQQHFTVYRHLLSSYLFQSMHYAMIFMLIKPDSVIIYFYTQLACSMEPSTCVSQITLKIWSNLLMTVLTR